jgi:hypothetical protein
MEVQDVPNTSLRWQSPSIRTPTSTTVRDKSKRDGALSTLSSFMETKGASLSFTAGAGPPLGSRSESGTASLRQPTFVSRVSDCGDENKGKISAMSSSESFGRTVFDSPRFMKKSQGRALSQSSSERVTKVKDASPNPRPDYSTDSSETPSPASWPSSTFSDHITRSSMAKCPQSTPFPEVSDCSLSRLMYDALEAVEILQRDLDHRRVQLDEKVRRKTRDYYLR